MKKKSSPVNNTPTERESNKSVNISKPYCIDLSDKRKYNDKLTLDQINEMRERKLIDEQNTRRVLENKMANIKRRN